MNKKGYTLIELLATITILGIIMLIAVPNVVGIIDRNKRTTYIEDAKKLVTLAEYKFKTTNKLTKPTNNNCIVIKMNYLDTTELQEAPNGGEYEENTSLVVIKRSGNKYLYYVQLVEKLEDNTTKGIELVESSLIAKEGAMMDYVKDNIPIIVNNNYSFKTAASKCNSVTYIYED